MKKLQSCLCRVDAPGGQNWKARNGFGNGRHCSESDGSDGITCTQWAQNLIKPAQPHWVNLENNFWYLVVKRIIILCRYIHTGYHGLWRVYLGILCKWWMMMNDEHLKYKVCVCACSQFMYQTLLRTWCVSLLQSAAKENHRPSVPLDLKLCWWLSPHQLHLEEKS